MHDTEGACVIAAKDMKEHASLPQEEGAYVTATRTKRSLHPCHKDKKEHASLPQGHKHGTEGACVTATWTKARFGSKAASYETFLLSSSKTTPSECIGSGELVS